MPFTIVRNDITRMQVDAIVNSAAPHLLGGGGADGAIHRAAGPELTKACRALGGCKTGQVKLTKGYRLPCRYIIHTVGPVWLGGMMGEEQKLRSCYRNALALAKEQGFESIAFPLISSGIFAVPRELAIRVAMDEIGAFVLENDLMVYLVVYDPESFRLSKQLHKDIRQYIDDHYVSLQYDEATSSLSSDSYSFSSGFDSDFLWEDEAEINAALPEDNAAAPEDTAFDGLSCSESEASVDDDPFFATWEPVDELTERIAEPSDSAGWDGYADTGEYCAASIFDLDENAQLDDTLEMPVISKECSPPLCAAKAPPEIPPAVIEIRAPAAPVTEEEHEEQLRLLLRQRDESFTQMLLRKIDEKGMTDPECYRRANIDRRLFSKIRNNLQYKPSKQTALAFAVALRMNRYETEELLRTAGLALSRSSKFDIIVEYCLAHHLYDVHQINRILYDFDQMTLGV